MSIKGYCRKIAMLLISIEDTLCVFKVHFIKTYQVLKFYMHNAYMHSSPHIFHLNMQELIIKIIVVYMLMMIFCRYLSNEFNITVISSVYMYFEMGNSASQQQSIKDTKSFLPLTYGLDPTLAVFTPEQCTDYWL